MRLFLDTNVLLDFTCHFRAAHEAASKVVQVASERGDTLIFSTSQATDCYYILRHYLDDATVRDGLRLLFQICNLCPTSSAACVAALDSEIVDYEDAVQAEVAHDARCDYIITRDLRDYASSPVPIVNPTDFLAITHGNSDPLYT